MPEEINSKNNALDTIIVPHRPSPNFVSEHADSLVFYTIQDRVHLTFFREMVEITQQRGDLAYTDEEGTPYYNLSIEDEDTVRFREDCVRVTMSVQALKDGMQALADVFGYRLVAKEEAAHE